MVIEVETFPRSMPWKSRSMSSTVSIATPTRPTSPRARGLSESWPICVGRSNAVERPVCPEAGVLAHRPEPAAVHGRLDAARVRVLAREPQLLLVVRLARSVERVELDAAGGRE